MKKEAKIKLVFLVALFVICHSNRLLGRQVVQVVTKTINREIDIKAGDTLKVFAEKAQVHITGWQGSSVVLKLELISKHPKRAVAEEELAYLDYQIEKKGGLLIRNYFSIANGFRKVKGSLSARYELKVPEALAIQVQNKYGTLNLRSLKGFLKVDTRFVNNTIENCDGEQSIEAIFGKTDLLNSGGMSNLNLQKADLNVNYHTGKVKISSNYGFASFIGDRFQSIEMESSRTTIGFTLSDLSLYNYMLVSNNSKVIVPGVFEERKDESRYEHTFGADKPWIKITNTFKPITLNLQYNASNK